MVVGPVGPLIEFDLFHMFAGWRLYQVHSVHSEEKSKPGKGHGVEGHCAASAANTTQLKAQGPGSRVEGPRTENSKH